MNFLSPVFFAHEEFEWLNAEAHGARETLETS